MIKKLRIYNTLTELPMWNWSQVDLKKDLRYLYILDYYDTLPRQTKKRSAKLLQIYTGLILQFDNLQAPLLEAKNRVLIRIIDLVLSITEQSQDVEKITNASTILRAMMITDDPDPSWLYSVKFTETDDQITQLNYLAQEIAKYQKKRDQQKGAKRVTYEQQMARLEQILGVSINSRRTSVSQFIAYQREATAMIKLNNKNLN